MAQTEGRGAGPALGHPDSGVRPLLVDGPTFEEMVARDRFLEWAFVHGNRYGTAHSEVEEAASSGIDLIFDIDYQGARQIKARHPEAVDRFVIFNTSAFYLPAVPWVLT